MLKTLRIFSLVLLAGCILIALAKGEYRDPTTTMNVNEQTDLFEESVDNWSGLQAELTGQKNNALGGVKSSKGLESLTDKISSEITQSAESLSSIDAVDLNSRGSEELGKTGLMNDIYVDFNRPLHKQSMVDARKLANAQNKLIGNLLGKLKDIGVDCRTVKGLAEKEPAYYLQIEETQHKDTVYNKSICEELRNQYRCSDSVSLTCKKTGKRYGEWQAKTIRFSGHTLHWNKVNWGYAVKWKRKRWGWHITPYHPKGWGKYQIDSIWRNNPAAIIADARSFIAEHLKVDLEQIGEDIVFPASGRGIGNIGGVGCRWRVIWDEYEFGYQFRETYDICEQWSEDWTERCSLNSMAKPIVNKTGQRGK